MSDGLRSVRTRLAKLAASRRPPAALLIGTSVLALAVWWLSHLGLPWALWSRDAHEYAEMGRRLAAGEGFTTGIIYPAELAFGVAEDRPAVMRPPGWPALLGLLFAAAGPQVAVVHAAVSICFAASIVFACALATRCAGAGAGLVAAVATATSPAALACTIDGASEALFALLVTLAFLLVTTRKSVAWLGAVCGLAYLTRYNGAALLPAVLLVLWLRSGLRSPPLREFAVCLATFLAVALPWWIRNLVVAGSPFYSLLNLNLWFSPEVVKQNASLYYMLEPDLASPVAADPIAKFATQLPFLLVNFPLASANLAAFAGVVLACARRSPVALGFALLALTTLVGVSFGLPLGRYFAPFAPVLIAVGVAAWFRQRAWLAAPALVLVLLAPLLPSLPPDLPDVRLFKPWVALAPKTAPPGAEELAAMEADWAACLAGRRPRPVLVAQSAGRLGWATDAVAIYAPASAADFWRIVEEHGVELVQLPNSRKDLMAPPFGHRFAPRPDCGPEIYGMQSD